MPNIFKSPTGISDLKQAVTSRLRERRARPLPVPLTSAGAGSLSSGRPREISAPSRVRHVQQPQLPLGCKLGPPPPPFDRSSTGQEACYEVGHCSQRCFCGAACVAC